MLQIQFNLQTAIAKLQKERLFWRKRLSNVLNKQTSHQYYDPILKDTGLNV